MQSRRPIPAKTRLQNGGFTLIEIMIVVIILGILAGAVIAQFSTAGADSRRSAIAGQLQTVRQELQVYRAQHNDQYPDLVGKQWAQMTDATDQYGAVSDTGLYGPYLPKLPRNMLNNNINVVANIADADVNTGWVYTQSTGALIPTNQTPTILYDETTGVLQ